FFDRVGGVGIGCHGRKSPRMVVKSFRMHLDGSAEGLSNDPQIRLQPPLFSGISEVWGNNSPRRLRPAGPENGGCLPVRQTIIGWGYGLRLDRGVSGDEHRCRPR